MARTSNLATLTLILSLAVTGGASARDAGERRVAPAPLTGGLAAFVTAAEASEPGTPTAEGCVTTRSGRNGRTVHTECVGTPAN
ncbi:MAG: hypothetical protein KDK03_07675 [Rhodobacteraceae bacterium]|nr:hypothetical protein [Paracoccaceae bacterium]